MVDTLGVEPSDPLQITDLQSAAVANAAQYPIRIKYKFAETILNFYIVYSNCYLPNYITEISSMCEHTSLI